MSEGLEARIRQVRADIEVMIGQQVDAIAERSPGVPKGVIRNLLTARAPNCPCAQYLELTDSPSPQGMETPHE